MSLATNLLFISHRRLAVALAEMEILTQDVAWFGTYRKAREFGELLSTQLYADEVFVREKLADLGDSWGAHWPPLHAKRLQLNDEHHRLIRAIESRHAADAQRLLLRVSEALEDWAQARMAALACIESIHGDVSTELAQTLGSPAPDFPSD